MMNPLMSDEKAPSPANHVSAVVITPAGVFGLVAYVVPLPADAPSTFSGLPFVS